MIGVGCSRNGVTFQVSSTADNLVWLEVSHGFGMSSYGWQLTPVEAIRLVRELELNARNAWAASQREHWERRR